MNGPVGEVLTQLKELQKKYVDIDFEEIPEGD